MSENPAGRDLVPDGYSTPEATKKLRFALIAERNGKLELAERQFDKAVELEREGK